MKEYKINNKIYRLNLFKKLKFNEAYLIGYLLGDGGYYQKTKKRKDRIFVSSTEKYIILFFKNFFCPDNKILSKIPINKKRKIISKIESHVLVFSSKFSEIFRQYGLMNLKEKRTFHNINMNVFPTFLLGLFDSDGNFSWGFRRDRNRLWCQFKITHPNQNMLKKLQKYLSERYFISTYINVKHGEKCFVLQCSSIDSVKKIMKIIYQNKPDVFNYKKYKNYLKFLKNS